MSVGHGGCQDTMEVAWVGCGGGRSKGAHGYVLVMCKECGDGLRAGVWGVGHGGPSECGDTLVEAKCQTCHACHLPASCSQTCEQY